uniref:SKA complex subunit 1 n=1 Tax=Caenorhabditis tropicalis TaxID=1561998 RepID=A0A1I7T8P0_9PELO
MSFVIDQFVTEKNRKLEIYQENIPDFERTITNMNNSFANIKTILQEISNAEERTVERCKDNCFNCSPAHLKQLLGIELKQIEELSAQGPSRTEEKVTEKTGLNNTEEEKISEQEFNTIPKYQLGRLTRDNLNEIVGKMDEFLMKKNHIFGKTNKQLSRIDRELLDSWKALELKSKGRLPTTLFFVESDIRPLLQERLRPSFSKAIPCLRHIRRVREERCGPLTFYYS